MRIPSGEMSAVVPGACGRLRLGQGEVRPRSWAWSPTLCRGSQLPRAPSAPQGPAIVMPHPLHRSWRDSGTQSSPCAAQVGTALTSWRPSLQDSPGSLSPSQEHPREHSVLWGPPRGPPSTGSPGRQACLGTHSPPHSAYLPQPGNKGGAPRVPGWGTMPPSVSLINNTGLRGSVIGFN